MADLLDSGEVCRLLYNNPIQDESGIMLLRSRLLAIAQRLGFPEIRRQNMVLVASEIASNQLKYAGGRGMLQIWQQPGPVVDVVGLDFGPGIADVERALQDGYSTSNTLGKGLGSILRLSDEAHIFSQMNDHPVTRRWSGVLIVARFFATPPSNVAARAEVGLFSRSMSDDRFNGDRIYLARDESRVRWLHLDGLGHGEIAQATTANLGGAIRGGADGQQVLEAVDQRLQGSRGAVAVVADLDLRARTFGVTGVGDMHAHLHGTDFDHTIMFAPGVLGRDHKQPRTYSAALRRKSTVVTASDGIRRNWDNDNFPGLFDYHPQLIAYLLGNIMGRVSDDQSLCVVSVGRKTTSGETEQ